MDLYYLPTRIFDIYIWKTVFAITFYSNRNVIFSCQSFELIFFYCSTTRCKPHRATTWTSSVGNSSSSRPATSVRAWWWVSNQHSNIFATYITLLNITSAAMEICYIISIWLEHELLIGWTLHPKHLPFLISLVSNKKDDWEFNLVPGC